MRTYKHFKTKILDSYIMLLGFDLKDKPVNVLSSSALRELTEIVQEVLADKQIKGVVIVSLKNSCFIAGADINELRSITGREKCEKMVREALELLDSIENGN